MEYIQKQKAEAFVFAKLEEYSREKSTQLFHLTSYNYIRRRLKRDMKYQSKHLETFYKSDEKILQWIDNTLSRIQSHLPHLLSFIKSHNTLKELLLTDSYFSSNDDHNEWQKLQIERAKELFPDSNYDENELLSVYQKYILEQLTPKKLESFCLPLKDKEKIDLNSEYAKVETIGREYLKTMFDDYKKRKYPNLNLIKEMIHVGMEQMIKRPKSNDFYKAVASSNILTKAMCIIKSQNAYTMSLKNIADDFMVIFVFSYNIKINLMEYILVLKVWPLIRQSK